MVPVVRNTTGRMYKYELITSSVVDKAKKNAKPRTGPTANQYSKAAPSSEAPSAFQMVPMALLNDLSTADRTVRPLRMSSRKCS